MRLLAPTIATTFPRRAPPPLPPQRVEHPTTPQEWVAFIGEKCRVAPRDNSGQNFHTPCVLQDIKGSKAMIALPNHRHPEWVDVSQLKRWIKGEAINAQHQAAHERNGHSAPSTGIAAVEIETDLDSPSQELEPLGRARRNEGAGSRSQRSVVPGKCVMRDSVSGKYFVGGRPGTLFDKQKHGFCGDIERAALTSVGALYQASLKMKDRGVGGFKAEMLTVEEAWTKYQERHPALDAWISKQKAAVDRLPEPEVLHVEAPAAPAPAPVAEAKPEAPPVQPEPPAAVVVVPHPAPAESAPRLPALVTASSTAATPSAVVVVDDRQRRIVIFDRVAVCMREKAAADALALKAQGDLLEAEAEMMIEIKRKELGL